MAKELYFSGPKPDKAINLSLRLEATGTLIAGVGVVIASRTRDGNGKLPI